MESIYTVPQMRSVFWHSPEVKNRHISRPKPLTKFINMSKEDDQALAGEFRVRVR